MSYFFHFLFFFSFFSFSRFFFFHFSFFSFFVLFSRIIKIILSGCEIFRKKEEIIAKRFIAIPYLHSSPKIPNFEFYFFLFIFLSWIFFFKKLCFIKKYAKNYATRSALLMKSKFIGRRKRVMKKLKILKKEIFNKRIDGWI